MANEQTPLLQKPAAVMAAQVLLWVQAGLVGAGLVLVDLGVFLLGLLATADTWESSKGRLGLVMITLVGVTVAIGVGAVFVAIVSGRRRPWVLTLLIGVEAVLIVLQLGSLAWSLAGVAPGSRPVNVLAPGTVVSLALPGGIIALLIAGRRYYT